MIICIACIDADHGIGKNHGMPWHNVEDLQLFKQYTLRQNVVMGKTTWEHLPKKLNDRIMHIITHDEFYQIDNKYGYVHHDLSWIHDYIGQDKNIFIAGGANIYQQMIPYADLLYISHLPSIYDCDCRFPDFENDFECLKEVKFQTFTFKIWKRKDVL